MKSKHRMSRVVVIVTLAVGLFASMRVGKAQEPAFDSPVIETEGNDAGRGTLFQWSYGTSFEGGPPGRDEPLASDRPDFTEASTTVGRGVAQVELGYTFTENNDGGVRTRSHSAPEMLWRIGMFADWFEFRIAFNAPTSRIGAAHQPGVSIGGSDDLYLGLKLGLTPQEGFLPEMALMPQMTVPTGHSDLTAGMVLPGLNWLYAWDVTDRWSVGGSTQINKSVDDAGLAHAEMAQSLTSAISLTERLGIYTEWFVLAPSGARDVHTQHYLDGGFTFSVSYDLQLDVRAGIGLSDASDDYFVGTGLVRRF